jgi:serine/threonine protein kinase
MGSLDNYTRGHVLGEGTFGKVYSAECRRTGRTVAMKLIKLSGEDEGIPPTALREITLLQDMRGHGNIVECVDCLAELPLHMRCVVVGLM